MKKVTHLAMLDVIIPEAVAKKLTMVEQVINATMIDLQRFGRVVEVTEKHRFPEKDQKIARKLFTTSLHELDDAINHHQSLAAKAYTRFKRDPNSRIVIPGREPGEFSLNS